MEVCFFGGEHEVFEDVHVGVGHAGCPDVEELGRIGRFFGIDGFPEKLVLSDEGSDAADDLQQEFCFEGCFGIDAPGFTRVNRKIDIVKDGQGRPAFVVF